MAAPISLRLSKIRLKIERAKHHIDDLQQRLIAFRKTDSYRVVAEKDAKTGGTIFRVKILAKLPDDFSCIIGDAIHNLRSAFDHLIWQLVEANGGTPGKPHQFPIYDVAPKDKTKFLAQIQGVDPGAEKLIDAAQPYNGGSQALWLIHKLDNIDKHRHLVVGAAAMGGVMVDALGNRREWLSKNRPHVKWPDAIWEQTLNFAPGDTIRILEDGDIIAEFGLPAGASERKLDDDVNLVIEIAFAEPQILKGQPVIPFLHQMRQFVDALVGQFVPFL